MDKVVLVMDMPECCADCSCSFFERDNPELNLICGATGEDANNVGKPDWCPLREVPEKKEICGRYPQQDGIVPSYKIGWNACIDAVTEREKSVE